MVNNINSENLNFVNNNSSIVDFDVQKNKALYHNEIIDNSNLNKLQNITFKELEFDVLLDIISKNCYSELGQYEILNLKPNSNIDALNLDLDIINEIKISLSLNEDNPFNGVNNSVKSLNKSKITGAILSSDEILNIKENSRTFRLVKNYYRNKENGFEKINNFLSEVYENKLLEKHIDDAIDENGNIKDNATKELARIRYEIKSKSGSLKNRIEKILKKTIEEEIVSEDFYTVREGRFVIPINISHKKRLPGIIHGLSQTGTTVFIEPSEIIETNNDLSILRNEEQREIYRILETLSSEIGTFAESLLYSTNIFAKYDSYLARAKYANINNGFKPIINDKKSKLIFDKIYHPLLIKNLGKDNSIPLSIKFDFDKRGHLISGPNAGGKTVALKSIGLNLIMALSGIFPIGECEVCYLDVFTSIGDHQSIMNNLSTFSSQIKQLKDIVDNSDENSLVLIDEICSGTDPQEGGALAQAILDLFIDRNLFFIVTTHQSSLKSYALNKNEIENASLEFDAIKIKPTYKFLSGIPGNSYAFHLSKSFGFSDYILNNAKAYLGDRQNDLELNIEVISKFRTEIENLKTNLEKDKLILEKKIKDYDFKNNEINIKKKKIIDDARQEAFELINESNKVIEKTIKEIRNFSNKGNNDNIDFKAIKSDFEKHKSNIIKEINNIEAEKEKSNDNTNNNSKEFKLGDKVRYNNDLGDENSYGIILELDKVSKNALVEFNGLKFKIKISKLSHFTGKEIKSRSGATEHIKFDAKTQIDLRGYRAEEAINELDKYISKSIISNLQEITILHGKGTGALRIAIQEFLKYHFQVISYRDGKLVEGGAGVTIAEL